ncbi:MAG: ABC transporter substrate-binding protein [Candidatus Hodarchaeota archaeon]
MYDKLKTRRFIAICFLLLITIQFIPINSMKSNFSEQDSEDVISHGIESSANLDPPIILKYISPPYFDWGIDYDIIRTPSYIASFVYDPLVEYSFDTEELMPALAKQWVVTNDSKHWIFTLRDDVTFHDGTKFNASSVKFTYDRFIDPTHPAYVAVPQTDLSHMPLESVEILEEFKVSINFNESYAPFIYYEAPWIGIFSPNSFGGGPNITVPIGTGPYYLDVIASNETFQKFIRNEQHFRGVPPFEEIQYFKYSSEEDFQAAVLAHEGDLTTIRVDLLPVSDTYWEASLGNPYGLRIGCFNHSRPIVNDQNVRLAINYAINKQQFTDYQYANLNEGVNPLRSVIYSGDPYHDKSIQGYPYNIDIANTILDNAGYHRLGDGYRFDIELVGWGNEELEAIKADLDLVGIRCYIVTGAFDEILSKLLAGDFDLFILGWLPLTDPSVSRSLLHTSGTDNYGGYSNAEIDMYTDLGQQTPVQQEREYYYFQVQNIAQEEAPFLLLQETKKTYLKATHVAPFIQMDKVGRLIFKYFPENQDIDIYNMEEIEVSSEPIYFPFTDGLVSLQDHELEWNMTMTHQFKNLIPNQQEAGKFYELQVNNSDLEYQIRCYYDLDEIHSSTRLKEQEIFQWNYSSQSWNKLEIVASNINLRFSEIQLKGNAILRLGDINLILLTFRYLPIILIIIGPIIVLISVVLNKNRNLMKKIKEEYDVS